MWLSRLSTRPDSDIELRGRRTKRPFHVTQPLHSDLGCSARERPELTSIDLATVRNGCDYRVGRGWCGGSSAEECDGEREDDKLEVEHVGECMCGGVRREWGSVLGARSLDLNDGRVLVLSLRPCTASDLYLQSPARPQPAAASDIFCPLTPDSVCGAFSPRSTSAFELPKIIGVGARPTQPPLKVIDRRWLRAVGARTIDRGAMPTRIHRGGVSAFASRRMCGQSGSREVRICKAAFISKREAMMRTYHNIGQLTRDGDARIPRTPASAKMSKAVSCENTLGAEHKCIVAIKETRSSERGKLGTRRTRAASSPDPCPSGEYMGAGNGRGILTIPAARLEQMWRVSTAAAAMFAAKWESGSGSVLNTSRCDGPPAAARTRATPVVRSNIDCARRAWRNDMMHWFYHCDMTSFVVPQTILVSVAALFMIFSGGESGGGGGGDRPH
ncbi:hypothetical protein C2E23DRAFT_896116 [Lenzites betulinus]|nr:hypothetical protein C2E23DRAFT_896116 [Lenzites betulinus]